MASPILGEFVGTFILILLGDGVVAGVLLKRSKGENAGWLAITAGWAFAVFAGVFTAIACGSSDAHLNPAVTLGAAVASGDFSKLLPYSRRATRGCVPRRRRRVDPLPAALGVDRRQGSEARDVLHHSRRATRRREPDERGDRHVRADAGGCRDLLGARVGRQESPPALDRSSSVVSSGASACRSAARQATRSTRHAISARAWRTRYSRSPASAIRIGATPRFPSLVH